MSQLVDKPVHTQKTVKVSAVMTAPRYEPVAARNQISRALQGAKIPLMVSGGVFYGQCMQIMLESLVDHDHGVDYALTVDFDSMFTTEHVMRLLSIIAENDEIDCLAAVQPKRGVGTMMATRGQAELLEWDGRPVKMDFAHFGLTVIDLRKLETVPKPWFVCVPDENGQWGDTKTDSDVYFWRQWKAAGHSLYIDPGCRLGHLEELVSVFDSQMQLQHMYPSEWNDYADVSVDA